MAKHVQLNNVEHAGVRIRTERRAELGDGVMLSAAFPHEFRNLQAHYPIVFANDAKADSYRPVALFGMERDENLFLTPDGWEASYLPLAVRMQPFLIGMSTPPGGEPNLEVHIDLDHPRIAKTEDEAGEALFLEHGGHTPFLKDASATLAEVHAGEGTIGPFVATLVEHDLIEPFTLDVTLKDGSTGRLAGFSTIAEEKFAALDADVAGMLHTKGMLAPIFMMIASVSQFEALIDRKNRALAHG